MGLDGGEEKVNGKKRGSGERQRRGLGGGVKWGREGMRGGKEDEK